MHKILIITEIYWLYSYVGDLQFQFNYANSAREQQKSENIPHRFQ